MSFRNKLKFLLVKKLLISNKEAQQLIDDGSVSINGLSVFNNLPINRYDVVSCKGAILQKSNFGYFAYYKPRGIECTFNTDVKNNLKQIINGLEEKYFYTGRLDKDSEGLLLLTNDGAIHDKLLRPEKKLSKTYFVQVNQPIDDHFIQTMQNGVEILGKLTIPAKLVQLNTNSFTIELTQGINRQIRRMCYKLGYEVIVLKRLSIGNINLNNMQPNELRKLTDSETNWLLNLK